MKIALKSIFVIFFSLFSFSVIAQKDIKIVVTAAFVSERGMPVYHELANYMSKKLNRNVKIVSNLSYKNSGLLLDKGIVQVGFVCGLPYIHKKAQGKQELLAIPISATIKNKYNDVPGYEKTPGKYFSYTIVHKDSKIKSWKMLKGKTYTYNDQESNSGYNMPRYKLIKLGAKSWDECFSKVVVSGSHEESIRLVSQGLIDASSVGSLVLDYDRYIKEEHALNVKVIETLFPSGAGAPPVVVSTNTPKKLREELKDIFINMHKNKEGRKVLKQALLLRFDKPNDKNYDDIRFMEVAAKNMRFRDHKE